MDKFYNIGASKIKTILVLDFDSVISHISWLQKNRANRHDFKRYPAKVIRLDFSKSRFLKPYHIAPLACVIHEYKERGFQIQIIKTPAAIDVYLKNFNFYQFCNGEDDNNFPKPYDSKTLPLWRIDKSGINLYPIHAQKYFESNHLEGKDLFILSNSLAELMNNVFDHSLSRIPGYTFTQLTARNNQIVACLCDFGKGIPKNVNEYLKNHGQTIIGHDLGLRKALETKFSTKTKPHNRGFGWETIFSSIKSIQSKILVVSNDALYWLLENGDVKSQLLNVNFPGTLVVIYINTLHLLPKEDELEDELTIL